MASSVRSIHFKLLNAAELSASITESALHGSLKLASQITRRSAVKSFASKELLAKMIVTAGKRYRTDLRKLNCEEIEA